MTVNYETYTSEKQAFIRKHGKKDWKVETSPMDEYGIYYKDYIFEDGAHFYERMAPVYFKQEVEVAHTLVKVEVEIKMMEIEYFDSDNAESRKYYEKW